MKSPSAPGKITQVLRIELTFEAFNRFVDIGDPRI
jgi:hypothetical protein